MKQFLIKSTILTLSVLLAGVALYATILKEYYISVLPVVLFFFFIFTNLVHAYLLKSAGKSNTGFAARNMAVSFLKMFFYLVVAVVYIALNKDVAKIFIVNFLTLYVIFTIFEVYEYSKFVRRPVK